MLIFALARIASDPVAQHTDAELAQCKTQSTPRCRFLVVDADWDAYASIAIASDGGSPNCC